MSVPVRYAEKPCQQCGEVFQRARPGAWPIAWTRWERRMFCSTACQGAAARGTWTASRPCGSCGRTKPLDAFYRRAGDRVRAECIECHGARVRADHQRRLTAPDADAYRRRRVEAARAWRVANPEWSVERNKTRYAANRDAILAEHRANRSAYTDRQRARRHRCNAQFVEHVASLAVLEMDDGVCGICGQDVDPRSFVVDHIHPLSKGGLHSYANVQVAHPSCNSRKAAKVV